MELVPDITLAQSTLTDKKRPERIKGRYTQDMLFRIFAVAGVMFAMFFAVATPTFAAGVPAFTLSINPRYPAPYSTAVVTPLSTVLDLSISTMSVTVNGVATYQGNVQPFPAKISAPGTKTSIVVTLTSGGQKYTEGLTLTVGDVALVKEPRSTSHPLYPGKSLVPLSGSVRVVAVPDFRTSTGVRLNPATLAYTWTVDNAILQNSSGIGKDSIIVAVPLQYRERIVSVVVKTQDGTQVSGGSVPIAGTEPTVRVYENDPLLGIRFDRALMGTFSIGGGEVSLFGVPYSFSTDGGAPAMSWLLNGSGAQQGRVLTLRPQGSGQGSASLSFSANKQSTFESASTNLSVSFGNTEGGGGIFGL